MDLGRDLAGKRWVQYVVIALVVAGGVFVLWMLRGDRNISPAATLGIASTYFTLVTSVLGFFIKWSFDERNLGFKAGSRRAPSTGPSHTCDGASWCRKRTSPIS